MSCTSNIEAPALPTDIGPPHPAPDHAWTDLTYLLHRSGVSWAYYLKKGKEPDCETGEMFCKFKDQDPRTPGIWNPLPSFDTRDRSHVRFGALEYRSGLVLTSSFRGFGGLSGLRRIRPHGGHRGGAARSCCRPSCPNRSVRVAWCSSVEMSHGRCDPVRGGG